MRDVIKLGIILLIYSVVAGGALGYVNIQTKPKITENKKAAENSARAEVLPGADGGFEEKKSGDFTYLVGYKDASKTAVVGYIFLGKGKGYSSVIETLCGVGPDGKITGIKVVFQQETPGLGTQYVEKKFGESDYWFYKQFVGKSSEDNLKVKKDGGIIDATTGATVSPRAITNSIKDGLIKLKDATGV